MKRASVLFHIFAGCLLFIAGCGSNVPLKGKVSYSDDGSPVTMGSIYFVSSGHMARSQLNSDGTFVVGSLRERDGLPKGTYLVYLQDTSPVVGTTPSGDPIYQRLVDAKYECETTSGITVEVPAPKGRIEIVVDRHVSKNNKAASTPSD